MSIVQDKSTDKAIDLMQVILDQQHILLTMQNTLKGINQKSEDSKVIDLMNALKAFSESSVETTKKEEPNDDILDDEAFSNEISDHMRPEQHVLDSYQNWAIIMTKKEYIIPPVENISYFQPRNLTVAELVRKQLFVCTLMQYGEDRADVPAYITQMKSSGIDVLYPKKLSEIRRMLEKM